MGSLQLGQAFQQIEMVLTERHHRRIEHVAIRQTVFAADVVGRHRSLAGCMPPHGERGQKGQLYYSAAIHLVEAGDAARGRGAISHNRKRTRQGNAKQPFPPLKHALEIRVGEIRMIAMVQVPNRHDERMIADAPCDLPHLVYQSKIDVVILEQRVEMAAKAPETEPAKATQNGVPRHGRGPAVYQTVRATAKSYGLDAMLQQTLA